MEMARHEVLQGQVTSGLESNVGGAWLGTECSGDSLGICQERFQDLLVDLGSLVRHL